MLYESRRLAEPPVIEQGKHGHAATIVVCNQNVLAGLVQRDVARPRTARRNLIQQGEFPCLAVNRESAHRAALFAVEIPDFIHRVKEFAARMHCEKRRGRRLRRHTDGVQLARLRVEPVRIDTLAAGLRRVRPRVRKIVAILLGVLRVARHGQQQQGRHHSEQERGKPAEAFHCGRNLNSILKKPI